MMKTPEPIGPVVVALARLLGSIESSPSGPATVAFKAAITRNGRELHAAAGPEALAAVLARIRVDAPDKAAADEREAIVRKAWQGITDAKDRAA